MTIFQLKEIIKDYPDNSFVHVRIWLNGFEFIDSSINRSKCGVDGSLLLIGDKDDKRSKSN